MAANVQASGEGSEALARWRAREVEIKGVQAGSPAPTRTADRAAAGRPARGSNRGPSGRAAISAEAAPGVLPSFTFESFGLL